MKKLLSVFLVSVMLLSVVPLSVIGASAETVTSGITGDCDWVLNGTVLTISGNGETEDYNSNKTAPWGTQITEVIIKKGVYRIGEMNFAKCSYLTKVTLPSGLKKIGYGAFASCIRLKEINLPSTVTIIGACAFWSNTSLESIFLPQNLEIIAKQAFEGCYGLKRVYLPNSLKQIDTKAFNECDYLELVCYGGAWKNAKKIKIDYHNLPLKDAGWLYADGDNVTDLDKYINSKLTSEITLLDSLSGVWSCFENRQKTMYTGLLKYKGKWFYVKNGVWDKTADKVISYNNVLFYVKNGKWSKETKAVRYKDELLYIKNGKWDSTANLNVKYNGKKYTIKNGKCQDVFADSPTYFYGNVGHCKWELYDGVLTISGNGEADTPTKQIEDGEYTIYVVPWKKSLVKDVVICEGVTSIGVEMFDGTAIKSIKLPDSLERINGGAFWGCSSLTNVEFGKNIKYIGTSAFAYCYKLLNIQFPDTVTQIGEDSLKDTAFYRNKANWEGKVLYCGKHLIKCDGNISNYTLRQDTLTIARCAFDSCTIDNLVLNEGIKKIDNLAFAYCTINSITIPESVVSITKTGIYASKEIKKVYYAGTPSQKELIIPPNYDGSTLKLHNADWECKTTEKIITDNGELFYYRNDQLYTEPVMVKDGEVLRYFKDGKWDNTFSGVVIYNEKIYYFENGILGNKNGIVEKDNNVYYLDKGKLYTSLYSSDRILIEYNGQYYYINNGVCDKHVTGIELCSVGERYSRLNYYYIKNGIKQNDSGVVNINGVLYLLKDGILDKQTTLAEHDGEMLYFKDGVNVCDKLMFTYNDKKYLVDKGYVRSDFSGMAKIDKVTYRIVNGEWDNTYSGLYKYCEEWFYVRLGEWNIDTGLKKYNNKWFYVIDGKWANKTTTLVKYNDVWFYVKNGKWVKDTLIFKYNGKRFYVKKGKVDFSFSGKKKINGKTYKIKNGKVV